MSPTYQEAEMFKFQWSKRFDAFHTISNLDTACPEGFIRQMRAGCPWQVVDVSGAVVLSGIGPTIPGRRQHIV